MSKISPSVPVVGEVVPFNAGDVERTLTYWTDDATVKLVGIPSGIQDSYNGKEQVRKWFQCLLAQHFQIRVKVIKVQGNIVITRTESRSDLTQQMGITALITSEVYLVNEGKIAFLTLTVSPKSRLGFQTASQYQHNGGGGSP